MGEATDGAGRFFHKHRLVGKTDSFLMQMRCFAGKQGDVLSTTGISPTQHPAALSTLGYSAAQQGELKNRDGAEGQ